MPIFEWVSEFCQANKPRIPHDVDEATRERWMTIYPSWDGSNQRPWEDYELQDIHGAIASFIIFGQTRWFRQTVGFVQNWNVDLHNGLLNDIKSQISYGFIFQRLWKALNYRFKLGCQWRTAARQFNVAEDDLRYIWLHLDAKQRSIVLQGAKYDYLLDPIPEADLTWVMQKLERHAQRLAQRKLAFIAKYDPCHDEEDHTSMLLVRGMAAVRNYEHIAHRCEPEPKERYKPVWVCRICGYDGQRGITTIRHDIGKILNFARRAMTNFTIDWIKYNTHDTRARIVNVQDAVVRPCTQCEANLDPGMLRCGKCGAEGEAPNSLNSYQATTLSLDAGMTDNSAGLHDIITGSFVNASQQVEDKEFWDELISKLECREVTFVKILLGDGPIAFDRWLRERYKTSAANISVESLKWYASRWLRLDKHAVERHLKHVMQRSAVTHGYIQPSLDCVH